MSGLKRGEEKEEIRVLKILLRYSWFTSLCLILLNRKVTHLYIFFFIFFSIMVYHRILNIAHCAVL